MAYEKLREQLNDYYITMEDPEKNPSFVSVRDAIRRKMDRYVQNNPDSSANTLKSILHEVIAERFEPVIFPQTPFFYEMGIRWSANWGIPQEGAPGSWLMDRRVDEYICRSPLYRDAMSFDIKKGSIGIISWNHIFDYDHHCLGYTKLFDVGIDGIISEIKAEIEKTDGNAEKQDFLLAALRSCNAVLHTAERFAQKAGDMLVNCQDPEEKRNLLQIAETAEHIPGEPPRTFYEALAMIWFMREVTASLENIGISVIGHLDRLLYPFYRDDISSGRLTESEARELLTRWMIPTDIKFFLERNEWPETSTCIELGGCDADGITVFNDVTRLVIEEHEKNRFVNPKLNCRYSIRAPREYLDMISGSILRGHNVFSIINDDVIIPSLIRMGKTEREARLFVNGGCQETMVEGIEHTAGAFYYFSMPRVLDLCLQPEFVPEECVGQDTMDAMPQFIESPLDFESFYTSFMNNLKRTISVTLSWQKELGQRWRHVHPCPLFSSTIEGCIHNGTDYSAGGAKFNPGTVGMVGLATLVDSLYAVKKAVFDDGFVTYTRLIEVLSNDWEDSEYLRRKMIAYPKFGHGQAEVDRLAARFIEELNEFIGTIDNERGGKYMLSMFVYYAHEYFSPFVKATPDGRKVKDLLSQSITPSRLRPVKSLTDTIRSLGCIDFKKISGISVLDAQLPLGSSIGKDILTSVFLGFAGFGGPTIQPNVVSIADLMDAKSNPERHRDLIVRIWGFQPISHA
ncbi:MAG: pyruvate formate lyase family protein [Bacillota bacterium]|nr:pyruvate formate lyase family protein [Bacillota bacterium]